MDTSRIKLDYVVENSEYVANLGSALDTGSVTVKKQVFELLTALCAYNAEGHARALETLEHYKVIFIFFIKQIIKKQIQNIIRFSGTERYSISP